MRGIPYKLVYECTLLSLLHVGCLISFLYKPQGVKLEIYNVIVTLEAAPQRACSGKGG